MRSIAWIAVLLTAAFAAAQAGGNQPAASGQASAQAGAAQGAAAAPKTPQPKTKEEYDAYVAAAQQADPNQLLTAADQFAQKFPDSQLRELLYERAMTMFQQQNNPEKEIEAGRKAIALDPTNPIPLIHVSSALVEVTRDSDLDKEQRYAEAAKDAQTAIDNIDTGLHVPPNVTPQQLAAVKSNIVTTAYETLGVIDMNKQDFAAAETQLKKAVDASKDQPVARVFLRLSVVQDNQKKYAEALDSANKALQYSQAGTAENNLAKQQQARLQKLAGSGSQSSVPSPGATPAAAPSGNTAPTGNTANPPATTTNPQPH